MFATLIEDILPTDYFSWMIGVIIDLDILSEMVALFKPELEQKFQDMSAHPVPLYSLQWLVCLYTSIYPETVTILS